MSIRIFYEKIDYRLRGWRKIKNLIGEVISDENKIPGDLNFIITSDEFIRNINWEYLRHDYMTDVLSFRYNEGKVIDGDVYVSIDTVKRNALNYKVSFRDELVRVCVHGVLHLCGYEDIEYSEKDLMTQKEDKWLKFFGKG